MDNVILIIKSVQYSTHVNVEFPDHWFSLVVLQKQTLVYQADRKEN